MTDALPNMFTSPVRTVRALREVGRTAVRLARRALDGESGPLSIPLGAPEIFATPVRAEREVALAELSLDQVKAVKHRFGITLNDVVLALCSGALRTHLRNHDQETGDPLVAIVPVSVRGLHEGDALGNRLSVMFVPLANDRESVQERIEAVVASSASNKAQERAVGYGPLASAVSDAVLPALARPMIRAGTQWGAVRRLRAGNLMVSNVPGPNVPLFFAGMRLRALHPLGPVVDGVALNITVQSYLNSLFVGINASASAVPDLPALGRLMGHELALLAEAAADGTAGAGGKAGPTRGAPLGTAAA
jgi:WS/DGAT/MGAT family acyltransferase